jgi:hypothetical protein
MLETETMNDDHNDEFDPRLEELFRQEHAHLPAEPFATATLRAIAADRKRIAIRNRLLQAAAVIALIVLSPRLIEASVLISSRLDELFASASTWLASPLGLVGAAVAALLAVATKWARIW